MGGEFEVTGIRGLEDLGKRFQQAGNKDLRKELATAIRMTNKPIIAQIRESAVDVLPEAGGLGALIAKSAIGTRTRLTGNNVYVRIQGTSKHNIAAMNAGRLTKPVFGNREVWAKQSITPGWFDKPITASKPQILREVNGAMTRVARKIEKGR